MPPLTSTSNARIVAAVRAVERGDRMLLEGARMLSEALEAGLRPESVYHTGEASAALLARARGLGAALVEVDERVLRKLSDLPSVRGVAALATPPAVSIDTLAPGLALLLDGVQDPSNVGAMVRSAEAFGAGAVLLTAGSAGPFTPRALRASAGSALRLPIVPGLSPGAALAWIRASGAVLAGAEAHGGEPPASLSGRRPLVLGIGSEGHGFSPEIAAALDVTVTIPLAGRVESLNAAVAAALLLYVAGAAGSSPKTSASNR